MIRLGHQNVWDYTWDIFLGALEFETEMQKK